MKHFVIVVLLIAVSGCENVNHGTVTEPDGLQLNALEIRTLDSKLRVTNSSLYKSLTASDREVILTNLQQSGTSITTEQFDALMQIVDVAIPVVESLKSEMPLTLRDATGGWNKIIQTDPDAAAFVVKVRSTIEGQLTAVVEPNVLQCDTGIMVAIFLCLRLHTSHCNMYRDEACVTLGSVVEFIQCVYMFCTLED